MEIRSIGAQGTLAEASYSDFRNAEQPDRSYKTSEVELALIAKNFSPAQAKNFITHWRVVDHQPNTLITGFSATLFESLDIQNKYVLAIRGTEPLDLRDWIVDGVLATDVVVPQFASLNAYYEDLLARGVLDNGQAIDITGHSLGGLLTQLFAVDHPEIVSHAYTFNAPGLGGVATEILEIAGLANSSVPLDQISNYYAYAGIEVTAALGTQLGSITPLFIEKQHTSPGNHSIGNLVDALAVYGLLGTLDNTLALNQITPLMEMASNFPQDTLEAAVHAVGDLFQITLPSLADERDNLYRQLETIKANDAFNQWAGNFHLAPTLTLLDHAQMDNAEGLAVRYALDHLNSFSMTGDVAIYATHNDNGQLDSEASTQAYLQDRARMLSQIIRRNRRDSTLVVDGPFSNEVYEDVDLDIHLATDDVQSFGEHRPETATQYVFDSDQANTIEGGLRNDHLYGQAGDDTLKGNAGDDYLEGGAGNDLYTVQGGDGRDTIFDSDGQGRIVIDGDLLTGGSLIAKNLWQSTDGRHSYAFDGDLGDTGTLYIDAQIRVADFQNGQLGITLDGPASSATSTAFTLTGTDHTEHLWWGQLPEAATLDAFYSTIGASGLTGSDLISTALGDDQVDGGGDNDWIVTYAGNDKILGGDGNDVIFPGKGADTANGGTGDDLIVDAQYRIFNSSGNAYWDGRIWEDLQGRFSISVSPDLLRNDHGEVETLYSLQLPQEVIAGTSGNLTYVYTPSSPIEGVIEYTNQDGTSHSYTASYNQVPSLDDSRNLFPGGSGSDFLGGNTGADVLIGGAGDDRLSGGSGSDTLLGGSDNDIILGLQGDDLLDGGSGTDTLYGGSGADIAHAGAGNDTVFGDNGVDHIGENDTLYGEGGEDTLKGNGGDDLLDGGSGGDSLWGQGGHDTLIGGDGNDELHGGGNPDTLLGGSGMDRLFGDDQDDWLFGGDGADYLDGGEGADRIDGGADSATDTLFGGPGSDHFIYHPNGGLDLIADGTQTDSVLLQDILPEDVTVDVLSSTDGQPLLRLSIDPENMLLITDGLTGGPDTYIFSDGTQVSRAELIEKRMETALVYRLTEPGSLNGGRGDDTLAGSMAHDRLYGHAGNDTLAGGAGDDFLAGGEGNDLYLLGPGTGFDIIDESPGRNELGLLAGVGVSQLQFHRKGNDLLIELPGERDGATLKEFFAGQQTWSVLDKNGDVLALTPDSVTGTLTPLERDLSADALRTAFIDRIQHAYGDVLHVNGYRLDDDLLWHGEFINGTSHNRYTLGFEINDETSDANAYTRQLGWLTSMATSTQYTQQVTSVTSYAPGGVEVESGQLPGHYVDLNSLAAIGASGVQISRDAIPVYGQNTYYNPLTGELSPEIKGYMEYPSGNGSTTTTISQQWIRYNDYDLRVNILNLTLGEGDDRFELQYGDSQGFNLVDGGPGNDWLDAGQGADPWERPPYSIPIPGSDYWPWPQLPGSLLDGNTGNDHLIGSDGEDELIGGAGDDYMEGGVGNDTYRIGATTGMDIIYENGRFSSDLDRLVLPQDISRSDVWYSLGTGLYENPIASNAWNNRVTSLHSTFTINWGAHDGVTLILPHTDQQAGTGIEAVVFGDGQTVDLTTLLDQVSPSSDADPQSGGNQLSGSQYLHGYSGDDILTSSYSGTAIRVGRRSFFDAVLIGGAGSDHLNGGDGADLLFGNDIVSDSSWDFLRPVTNLWDEGNEYDGGSGDDEIWTTAGSDLIHFGFGDGKDLVTDLLHDHAYLSRRDDYGYPLGDARLNDLTPHLDDLAALYPAHLDLLQNSIDTLRFDPGVLPSDVQVLNSLDNGLSFSLSDGHSCISFTHWFDADLNQLGRVEFSDGTYWNRDDIEAVLRGEDYNRQPVLTAELPRLTFSVDQPLNFTLPDDWFSDPEGGSVEYRLTTQEGANLPDWISFDAQTRTLQGAPPADAAGEMPLQLVATDAQGKMATATLTLDIAGPLAESDATSSIGTSIDSPPPQTAVAASDHPSDSSMSIASRHSVTPSLPSALSTVFDWLGRNQEGLPPFLHKVAQAVYDQLGANDHFPSPDHIGDEQIKRQWARMRRALTQLDALAGEFAPGTHHRYGIDPGILSSPLNARHRAIAAKGNALSLTPGDINLHALPGLARSIQQLR